MKHVLQVTDKLSRQAGGMFESVRALSRGINVEPGWRVQVLGLCDSDIGRDIHVWQGVETHVMRRSPFGFLGDANVISRRIKDLGPDVVHLHGLWGPSSKAVFGLLRAKHRPAIVVSPRGMLEPWALRQSRLKKWPVWKLWVQELVHRADCLHALCEEEKSSILKLMPNANVVVVPNGVKSLHQVSTVARERNMLFLGRLHPKKGLELLFEAWARLSVLREEGWTLTVAGWGESRYEASLRARVKTLGLMESVVFAGPAFGEQKANLFEQASAFVLPSLSEGLPMSVLEAWSYGIPVLMTNECHLADGLSAGGAVLATPDVDSLTVGLSQILIKMDTISRERMGAHGKSLVEQKYNWQRVCVDVACVYNEIGRK